MQLIYLWSSQGDSMWIYAILIGIIIVLAVALLNMKRYAKQLFHRSLSLELHLITIYEKSDDGLKKEIEQIINNIKPLV